MLARQAAAIKLWTERMLARQAAAIKLWTERMLARQAAAIQLWTERMLARQAAAIKSWTERMPSPTGRSHQVMDAELRSLRIDRSSVPSGSRRSKRSVLGSIALVILSVAGYAVYAKVTSPIEVNVVRILSASKKHGGEHAILSASGYVVAAHKTELAAKVVGRVAWIGVERGDTVKEGQELVRLESDEYRARTTEAEGQIENLRARVAELENGSRPEEINKAEADVDRASADLSNARVTLDRARSLVSEGVVARQTLDDVQARHDNLAAQLRAMVNTYRIVRTGEGGEESHGLRELLVQAEGSLAFARSQLANTVIRARSREPSWNATWRGASS